MAAMKATFFDGANTKSIPLDGVNSWSDFGIMPWDSINGGSQQSAPTLAASVAFLFRAIEIRSGAVASVPWAVFRGDTQLWKAGDPAPDALAALADLPELLQRTEESLCLSSQAFMFKEHNRVRLLNVRWLDPSTMTPVWTSAGLQGYKRQVNGSAEQSLSVQDVVYIWRRGRSETMPATPPVQAALAAANVIYNVDTFAKLFFQRGAIKATLLTVEGMPPAAEREKLKSWWQRWFSGVNSAFTAEVVSANVKPVVIGEGVKELQNTELTDEKREDIATALGVPHSLVMSNAANFATAEADRLNFYDTTIVPECGLIQRQMNAQLFEPMGLRFAFLPESLRIYQEDETKRATAFAAYVAAGIKPSIAAQMLGISLPVGIEYADLDPQPVAVQAPPPEPAEADDAGPESAESERDVEVKRLVRWAKKRAHPDVTKFASDVLTDDEKQDILAALQGAVQVAE